MNAVKSSQVKSSSKPSKSWYYYPWVWFILALLSSAVIGSFATLKIALDRPNDLMPVAVSRFALDTTDEKPTDGTVESIELIQTQGEKAQ